jgi:uncharacterized membrane protein YhaH (DUF805 family)
MQEYPTNPSQPVKPPAHKLPAGKLPERNPLTHAAHRKETFWQITLPLVILLLVFIGLAVLVSWAAVGGSDQVRRWADVAILWQAPLPIVLSLLCLTVNIGMVFAIYKLTSVMPGVMRLIHLYILKAHAKIRQLSDKLAAPFISASATKAKVRTGLNSLRRK